MRWLLALLLLASPAHAETISGQVVAVIDGDTLTLRDAAKKRHRIRLAYIDAPERGQPFYVRSAKSLAALCFRKPATAQTQGSDRDTPVTAKVECAGEDASSAQVKRGMAWTVKPAAPLTSALYEMEAYARLRQLGLWAGDKPVAPWEWRGAR